MKTRVITAIVALAVFVGVLLAPPIVFTIALAAVTVIMLFECYKATNADAAMKVVGLVSAAMVMAALYVITRRYQFFLTSRYVERLSIIAVLIVLVYMALVVFKHGKRSYKDILSSGFLTFYIIGSMWCLQFVKMYIGINFMLLIFISAWSCDTFAYFSGRFFGRHKLIPHVSPNKTVEGAIGGVIGSMLCCTVYLIIAKNLTYLSPVYGVEEMNITFITAVGLSLGMIGGVFSQLGDLVASSIKRDTGIKDFGWIFPGHGGFMDRFDSVMYIAPIVLIYLVFFCEIYVKMVG